MKYIIIAFLACYNLAFSQVILLKPFETKMAQGTEKHLKHYELVRFEVQSLINQINAIQGNVKEITIRTSTKTWQLQLFEYSLLSPNYIRYSGNENAVVQLPKRTDFRTFRGYIKGVNGSLVCMSIAHGFFSIMINENVDQYFIEPLDEGSLSNKIPAEQQFLLYKTADLIPREGPMCAAEFVKKGVDDILVKTQQNQTRLRPCKICAEVKVCLAADTRMYAKYGSSVPNTENQMLSIIADVQTVYDDEFDNEYFLAVTGTFVYDNPQKDPFNTINTLAGMLTQFATSAPQLFSNSQYNVATLWTSKFTTIGAEVGTAYQAQVCMNNRYNVCSDFWPAGGRQADYLTLQAHMMGHNFDMIHDIANSPCIMRPGPLINGSTCWSFLSKNSLNAYVRDNKLIESLCLAICPGTDAPIPEFSADITFGCQPVTVHFKDLSGNTNRWKWRFPGGTPDSSSLKNPIVVYKTVGIFPVTLEAGNDRCDIALTKDDFIEIHDLPFADFGFGVNPDKTVYFTDYSQRAVDYLWKFGDGEESDETNPIHLYDRDSTYEVSLTVTNDCGSRTIKKKVTVESLPIADFVADTTGGCAPKIIKFIDKSTNNVIKWQWKFTGGNPSLSYAQNPFVRYDNAGIYDAELTVYSAKHTHGLKRKLYIKIDSLPEAKFTFTINGNTVLFTNQNKYGKTHYWVFGDPTSPNNTSTDTMPSHTYQEGRYEVWYIVANACGDDTAKTILTIGSKPIAGFQVSDHQGCLPYQVQFTNTSTASANAFRWYFPGGNPSTSTDKNPLITYNAVGKYDVSLFAYNNFFSDSIGFKDFIEVKEKPTSNFTNVITGFKSFFTQQAMGATNYFWDFGDGKASFEENPIHDYGVEGEFDVHFIVQNECGIDTFIKHIAIYLVPKVSFTADTIKGCSPLKVKFFDKSSIDVTDWAWQFEGGFPLTSTEKNPVVIFNKKGKYTVQHTVKNTNGSNALTRPQYIEVLSTVLCPEFTKTKKFMVSEDPFGANFENRANDLDLSLPVVYPNPALDYLYVNTEATIDHSVIIEIFNLAGKKLSQYVSKENYFRIQTEQWKSGTYFMKINDGTNTVVRKIIISD